MIAGWHDAADSTYARWVDPDVNTQEDIDRQRAQLGWEPGVVGAPKTGAVDAAGGKSIPLRDAKLYAALAMLLGILLVALPALIF